MKYLTQFLHFDCSTFFAGKVLQTIDCKQWADYTTKEIVGAKITTVIVEDKTQYQTKDGEQASSNIFEKISVKIPGKTLNIAPGTVVELVNPVGTVYGDYRNQLSIRTEDVKVIQPAKA